MIYTLTLNPAVDYYITVDGFKPGVVNRTTGEKINFGGKGINVSFVLKELGVTSTALGFVGGFTGDALENHLKSKGIKCDFVKVQGNTRINVKLNDTDINASGPDITDSELQQLYKKLDNLKNGNFLVLSGNVPKSLPQNTYEIILERLKNRGVEFVVDAEKDLLLGTLKYKPFLIKPNKKELEEIFENSIYTDEEIILYAKELQEMGAENVLISMDREGAILITKDKKVLYSKAPKGKLVNSVGSGDSMVAGFLTGFITYDDYEKALKMGIAAGSASAFSKNLATKDEILYQLSKFEK